MGVNGRERASFYRAFPARAFVSGSLTTTNNGRRSDREPILLAMQVHSPIHARSEVWACMPNRPMAGKA
jgi:hypothetical protein